jgi:hypothetical protein
MEEELSLESRVLFDKLISDFYINVVKCSQQMSFSMNTAMQVESKITQAVIKEIKRQIIFNFGAKAFREQVMVESMLPKTYYSIDAMIGKE